MTEEISTPVETVENVDTSLDVAPAENADTAPQEPTQQEETAEIETQEPVLYAGKYKTVQDLEQGYKEVEKLIAKSSEFEKKYNDLVREQEEKAEKIAQQKREQAQQYGYRSPEEQEIDKHVKLAEYQYYAQNLNEVTDADKLQEVNTLLSNYYATGHKAYLDEAKSYFPIHFIEQVSNATTNYKNALVNDFRQKMQAEHTAKQEKIDNSLKQEFAEFLADSQTNPAKDLMYKALRSIGGINTSDDMKVFVDYYSQMAKYEREQAIKEFQAQKVIEETKNKAIIDAGTGNAVNTGLKDTYTAQEVDSMTSDEFSALYDKYGTQFTSRIK